MIRVQVSSLSAQTDVASEFPRWIIQNCNRTSLVLDVGAGRGRAGTPELIQPNVARLVGVDPDPIIAQNPYLDEHYQARIEDFAREKSSSFDCLYTRFVLEHVTQPLPFLSACRTLLKPGGMLFGVTPNLWHYFGMATKVSAALGIEDWLLERLIGREAKDTYHYPTAYSLNSVRAIKRTLARAGFREVEFKCFDQAKRFEFYFPKLCRWFPRFYTWLVYTFSVPQIMGIIMFKASV